MKCSCGNSQCDGEVHVDTYSGTILVRINRSTSTIHVDILGAKELIKKLEELIANKEDAPERVESLDHLKRLADEKRAVSLSFVGPRPAAFYMHMSGETIHGFLKRGLYVYAKKEKKA